MTKNLISHGSIASIVIHRHRLHCYGDRNFQRNLIYRHSRHLLCEVPRWAPESNEGTNADRHAVSLIVASFIMCLITDLPVASGVPQWTIRSKEKDPLMGSFYPSVYLIGIGIVSRSTTKMFMASGYISVLFEHKPPHRHKMKENGFFISTLHWENFQV